MAVIDASSVVYRIPGAIETSIGEEIVLLNLESGECLGLGVTGSAIWRCAAEPAAVAAIVKDLRLTFDAPSGVIEQDVVEFVSMLQDRGLIEVR